MTITEFENNKEIKNFIREILASDTENCISSIGIADYNLTSALEVNAVDFVDLYIFTEGSCDSLSDFISNYNFSIRDTKNRGVGAIRLYEETCGPDETACHSIYTAPRH